MGNEISLVDLAIKRYTGDWQVIVLKGFTNHTYIHLKNIYTPIEPDTIFDQNGQIVLNNINDIIFPSIGILSTIDQSKKFVMLFETFSMIFSNLNLDSLPINFIVLHNNFLEYYSNPTNSILPDFEEFIDKNIPLPGDDSIVSKLFSMALSIGPQQFIQYNDSFKEKFLRLEYFPLIPKGENPDIIPAKKENIPNDARLIYFNDLSFDNLKYDLITSNFTNDSIFLFCLDKAVLIQKQILEKLNIFYNFFVLLNIPVTFYEIEDKSITKVRPELFELLSKYWGSKEFRELKFYTDPDINKNLDIISQGDIIESIIKECESCYQEGEGNTFRDIFLTSPTGAGKSLLFQLPAIYIAEKYSLVTIVISPLIALMKDQVSNLKKRGYEKVVCLNSELTLIEREFEIKKIKEGETNIVYMSPELLLSYDISNFLDDRVLGLFVIDEAHLVTTWGRDFRVDYWYLGNYIRKLRNYRNKFPLVAVTATAVYDPSGINDMVFETLDSLSMNNAIKYLGKITRDDIDFDIRATRVSGGHETSKIILTAERIEEFIRENKKTIVYCPWTRQIEIIRNQVPEDIKSQIKTYYGNLDSTSKEQSYDSFKNGESCVMIATKAFGMGVDIDDILITYHHAPSGHLTDYVQEIGRLARRTDLTGIASIDFDNRDLKFTNLLYGLSSMKPFQVQMVLEKLNRLYKSRRRRNLLVSISDFEYIFNADKVDVEQKVKSALLLLEKDLFNKYSNPVIIARPKSLFTTAYIKVIKEYIDEFESKYSNFAKKVDNNQTGIYILFLDKIWEMFYSNQSFPMIKRNFYEGLLFEKDGIEYEPQLKIYYVLNKNANETFDLMSEYFDKIHETFAVLSGFFVKEEFEEVLESQFRNKYLVKKIADLILNIYSDPGKPTKNNTVRIPSNHFILSRRRRNNINEYRIFSNAFPRVKAILRKTFFNVFDQKDIGKDKTIFIFSDTSGTNRPFIKLAYILDTFNLGTYEISGGEVPSIFIRINDPLKIDLLTRSSYENEILKNIDMRHKVSVRIMEHFFTTEMDNKERWNFIEDFFLGKNIDQFL